LTSLRINTMLGALFSEGVVTFEEKQEIEHAQEKNRKGMKWFLDYVIIADLKQGNSQKYKRFIEIMENHDDSTLRSVAEKLG